MEIAHTLFLDACAIIYWVEAPEPWYGKFRKQLKNLQQAHENIQIAISDLSRLECLVKPLREGQVGIVKLYEDFFNHPDLKTQLLTSTVIEQALKIRVEYGLKTPDAIQVGSALEIGRPLDFVTADQTFLRVKGVDVVLIKE